MPIINVSLYPGRTPQKKAQIAAELTRVMHEVDGVNPQAITVIFSEVAPSDWFVAGASMAGPSTT